MTNIERIVRAARLPIEDTSSGSIYLELVGGDVCDTVRVSDHPRQSHHRSAWNFPEPDLTVLIGTAEDISEWRGWRVDAPREVREFLAVPRHNGERAATTARKLRGLLAEWLRASRLADA